MPSSIRRRSRARGEVGGVAVKGYLLAVALIAGWSLTAAGEEPPPPLRKLPPPSQLPPDPPSAVRKPNALPIAPPTGPGVSLPATSDFAPPAKQPETTVESKPSIPTAQA